MVEGYVLITVAIEAETGQRVWAIRSDPSASVFTVMGLARLAQEFMEEQVSAMLGYEPPEEE